MRLFVSISIHNDFTVVSMIVVVVTVVKFREECLYASEVLTDVEPEDDAM